MTQPTLRPNITAAWWPLALSWMLMGLELPLIAAVVGRLPQPELMLAAFGGVAFPLGLLIESPIIMMLAASTAIARDGQAWKRLNKWMHIVSAGLTALLVLLITTPLFEFVVVDLLDVPEPVRGPAWVGLLCLLPWPWAIADRRTRQGLLICYDRKIAVAQGTGIRLSQRHRLSRSLRCLAPMALLSPRAVCRWACWWKRPGHDGPPDTLFVAPLPRQEATTFRSNLAHCSDSMRRWR